MIGDHGANAQPGSGSSWVLVFLTSLFSASIGAQSLPDQLRGTLDVGGGDTVLPLVRLRSDEAGFGPDAVIDMSAIPADDLIGIGGASFVNNSQPASTVSSAENVRSGNKAEIDLPNCDDSDGDGVCNSQDYCQDTPADSIVLPSGCHLTKGAPLELVGVFFDFNGTALRSESREVLDRVVAVLRQQHNVVVEIGGHTDSRGREAINLTVSAERAKAVRDYLISRGIAAYRLRYRGYGSSQPTAPNTLPSGEDNAEGRARNRRVDMRVISEVSPESVNR